MAIELIGEGTEEAVAVTGGIGSIQTHALELSIEIALDLFRVIERVAVLCSAAASDAFIFDCRGSSCATSTRPRCCGALRPPHFESMCDYQFGMRIQEMIVILPLGSHESSVLQRCRVS